MTHSRDKLALQLAGSRKLFVTLFEFRVEICQFACSFLNSKLQNLIEVPHLFFGVPANSLVFHVLKSEREIVGNFLEQSDDVVLKHIGIGGVNAKQSCELPELMKPEDSSGADSLPQSLLTIVELAQI